MSRMERLSGRRGDMTSSGRHGRKIEKVWKDRQTLEPERISFRGEETRVRGSVSKEDN